MININNYVPINFIYYDPQNSLFKTSKSDRERVTVYTCNNSENCDAYKRNKCVMLNGLYSHSCPYGQIKREEEYIYRSCKKTNSIRENSFFKGNGDIIKIQKHFKRYCYTVK